MRNDKLDFLEAMLRVLSGGCRASRRASCGEEGPVPGRFSHVVWPLFYACVSVSVARY